MGDHKSAERCSLITMIVGKIVGRYTKIPSAPPRQALKMFGGYLTIDEFRKKHVYCQYIFNELGMKNFTFPEFYEISNIQKSNKTHTQGKQKLRLQRPRE